jgi:hypothetical protein
VPTTTISPPLSPPSGPRSIIQSAQQITARLRLITGIKILKSQINQIALMPYDSSF